LGPARSYLHFTRGVKSAKGEVAFLPSPSIQGIAWAVTIPRAIGG
jgi:hypothetical protein